MKTGRQAAAAMLAGIRFFASLPESHLFAAQPTSDPIGKADTAKQYLKPASDLARRWAKDAKLVEIVGRTEANKPGALECHEGPADLSWTLVFHSATKGVRCFSGCDGRVPAGCRDPHGIMNNYVAPPPINVDFIDSVQVATIVNRIADKKWAGVRCPVYMTLLVSRLSSEKKARPHWDAELLCDSGQVAHVGIDAATGNELYNTDLYDEKGD